MIVQTLKRRSVIAGALLLVAPTLFAAIPSARTGPRMAFDESAKVAVLFGGVTSSDGGTGKPYSIDETWLWNGERWTQQHPAHKPEGRDSHTMVYDSTREHVILFGGRGVTAEFNDTWYYEEGEWVRVDTANAPPARILTSMAFDRVRDRVVLYGGTSVSADGATVTSLRDMWEFDGTTWTHILDNGPTISKPLMFYDEGRDQLVMLGLDDKFATLMFVYDASARTWNQITPETLPPCVNESSLVYRKADQTAFFFGGACTVEGNQSGTTEEPYTWDGTNWTKLEPETAILRVTNAAAAYDSERDDVVMFGGTTAFGAPRQTTYRFDENDWKPFSDTISPGPRSLFGLASDPVNKITWVVGGLTDFDFYVDFWKFQNGTWEKIEAEGRPECPSPLAAFDTDRSRLVVMCPDSSTFEWDGEAWKTFTLNKRPNDRRFSNLVYDQTMKKTVLFGGFDSQGEYTSRTWLWDGTAWTELKKKKPHSRALASMWYDPVVKKTVLFGGVGRRDADAKIERYTDMWSLDANGWTEIKPASMPSTRYGAQTGVDPRTNHTILFGGLRLDTDEKGFKKQVYADDTWEWDGTTWRQLSPASVAPARENGALFFDPSTNQLTLFAGWSGYYHSDLWTFTGNAWRAASEPVVEPTERRRIAR